MSSNAAQAQLMPREAKVPYSLLRLKSRGIRDRRPQQLAQRPAEGSLYRANCPGSEFVGF